MALNGVFANELQFASTCEQTETDEREKDTESNADLEEGEIEDDEEEQQVEEKPPASGKEAGANETGNKEDVARPVAESTDNKPGEKQRDRRQPTNNLSNSAATRSKRSRAASHERDLQRKRRKTLENDSFGDNAGPEARGASPSRPYHRESGGSDLDDGLVSSSPRRRAAHDRRPRSGRGSPGRRRRGSSRERSDRRRDRSDRDRRPAKASGPPPARVKDDSICAFFMEGKCSRGSDCPYSHAALPPRKMELCKFYLMDCCAKKEKCLYLHKDFPCKFFHTGRKCRYTAETCKFSHDRLSETMRAILIKHIETAPREILGDFPRLTRDETIQAIDTFSHPPSHPENRPAIPSLFESNKTQDAFRESKLDSSMTPQEPESEQSPRFASRPSFYEEVAIGHAAEEVKEGKQGEENSRSIWFGTLASNEAKSDSPAEPAKTEPFRSPAYDEDFRQPPVHSLPARQRQLYRRIQQQQREPLAAGQDASLVKEERAANEKWYSSDEEEEVDKSLASLAKSIHGDGDPRRDVSSSSFVNADSAHETNAVEVAKALSGYPPLQKTDGPGEAPTKRDPRMRDPRKRSADVSASDVDLRTFAPVSSRLDVDLRFESKLDSDFRHPYAGRMDEMKRPDFGYRAVDSMMQRHAFQEIDASTSSNPATKYQLYPVDVEPIDYGSIKVQADWAHLDPRQQKNWASYRSTAAAESANTYYSPASPEPPSGPPAPMLGRAYDSYAPATHGDPRQRDPRGVPLDARGPSGFPVIPHHHVSEPEPFNPTYVPHHRSYPAEHGADAPRDVHRPVENRRDPRQRFRNQT